MCHVRNAEAVIRRLSGMNKRGRVGFRKMSSAVGVVVPVKQGRNALFVRGEEGGTIRKAERVSIDMIRVITVLGVVGKSRERAQSARGIVRSLYGEPAIDVKEVQM